MSLLTVIALYMSLNNNDLDYTCTCAWDVFQVMLLVGKDKGKIGVVKDIVAERNWVFVENLNCVKRFLLRRHHLYTTNETILLQQRFVFRCTRRNRR